MSASTTSRHGIGWGAAGVMVAAVLAGAAVATAAPVTSADGMLSMEVFPPAGGYVVGAQAGIQASIVGSLLNTPQSKVTFSDNGTCFKAFFPGMDASGVGAVWVPTTAGTHTITATQYGRTVSQTVTVAAAPAGTPKPTPDAPGCRGGGSIGIGDLNF
ncbi:hypothetical protein [Nocardia tengchongensis]|uniref:hypothetical protein n=1 Tax=Nocardia tengchongensis TaxID=2055889 RepID=UPI0036C62BC9